MRGVANQHASGAGRQYVLNSDASTTPNPEETAEAVAAEITTKEPTAVRAPRKNLGSRANRVDTEPALPSGEQFAASRATHWHQQENPLLSADALKDWLNRSGLVVYAPRAQGLGAPAPTFVEATLGRSLAVPEPAQLDNARSLLARLIADGAGVPLNLLGVTGAMGSDVPDFVVSAAVFSYIFTLRGNKAWKVAPATSGAVKVSPLALAAYEMIAAKGPISAYDLTTQLGKEVTEAAVLRSLTELWSQLRVLPVLQLDGKATEWELATARFTKQIKSGANAGQPTALSALISLYLGQVLAAEETEIETFLSPLAARSRVRDVIHALLGARQVQTLVIDGKTLVHVAGDLPSFGTVAKVDALVAENGVVEGGSRITKFAAKPGSKIGTGLRARPAAASGGFKKPTFGRAAEGGGERERRPFKREEGAGPTRSGGSAKPRFDKPWEEGKSRPAAGGDGAERPARRSFTPRAEGDSRQPRTFSKPGTFGRKREGGSATFDRGAGRPERSFKAERPARPGGFSASRGGDEGRVSRGPRREASERPATGGFKRPGSYTPRPPGERTFGAGAGGDRPKPAFGKSGFSKPSFGSKAPYGGRSAAGSESSGDSAAPRKVFRKFDAPRTPKPFGAKPFGARPSGGAGEARPSRGERPASAGDGPKRSFAGPRSSGDRPARPFTSGGAGRPTRVDGAGRPPAFGGAKKPFGKSGGAGKPGGFAGSGSTFAKFADGKKPFRKPGPGKPAGRKPEGGFAPVKRRRPEGNQ